MSENGFDIALPGSWWTIPVADPAETERAVSALVSEAIGRRDQDARVRAELRTRFLYAADRARSTGAVQLHLCRELMPDVPLPASLTVYWPRITLSGNAAGHGAANTDAVALRAVIGGVSAPGETGVESLDDLDLPCGAVLRRTRIVAADPRSPEAGVRTLEVDYWFAPPSRRVLLLSFACGMPELADSLTELFDLMVATVGWTSYP